MHKITLLALLASCTQSVQKPEKVQQIEEKRVHEPIVYTYKDGGKGTLQFDWETREKGIIK